MKRTTVFFLSVLFCLTGFGQKLNVADKRQAVSSYSGVDKISLNDVQEIVAQISLTLDLEKTFVVKQGNVKNIEASIKRKKQRIIYNPVFVNNLYRLTNNRWTVVALFAHEVGHHLRGHTGKRSGSRPHLELEADELAGYILQKMGASLEESTLVMEYIATVKGSKTHPARNDRSLAITNGWMKGNSEVPASASTQNLPHNQHGNGTSN